MQSPTPKTALFAQWLNGRVVIVDQSLTTGNVYFVGSGVTGAADSAGYGRSPEAPFATLAYAVGQVTANNGDIILVLPGHTETLAAAAAIACATADTTIIGLGNGSNRPTFTFATSTAATWTVTAANVTIRNIRVKTSIDELVSMFVVSAAYCTLDNVEFVDNGSTAQCLQFLLTTAAANYLTIKNCFHYQSNAPASASSWIQLVGTTGTRILDCVFFVALASNASSYLINGSTAVVMCEIARCLFLHDLGGSTATKIVTWAANSTGLVHDCRAGTGTAVSTAGAFDIANGFAAENYWADTVLKSGLLAPVVDTDT